ncbi:DUF6545 domain-containing protein [Streptomyces clavuligerus]|uniref:DUF6545 domain-containing protein n=1 Tax=Streptomyces clavuligerus TaxID=1901 RepID=UPI001F079BDC|nr:DUF6545 domain-containing protein [Streptomyces clavuligerus]
MVAAGGGGAEERAPTAPPGRVHAAPGRPNSPSTQGDRDPATGYLELRPLSGAPPGFADWAEDGFRRHPVAPPSEAAATEAAAVGAALEYLRSGRRPSAPGTAPFLPSAPVPGATVDAEVIWLTQVAHEFARSPVVAHVRRVAAERV